MCGLFKVLWNLDLCMDFLGVRTGPNGFLDLLASFLPKKKCWKWWIEGHVVPLYVRSLDFRKYIDFSDMSWLDFPNCCVPRVFLWTRSLDPLRRNSRGELLFPINMSDFPTKINVCLVKSRHQAQKRKFLFSGRVKFCRRMSVEYLGKTRSLG